MATSLQSPLPYTTAAPLHKSLTTPQIPFANTPIVEKGSRTNESNNDDADDDDPHSALPPYRKALIVFTTSWTTLAACFSSTSLLVAPQEIANDLHTTPEAVNISTGGVLLAIGLSGFIWSAIADILGRRVAYNACIAVLAALTVGTALVRAFGAFVALRVLSGFQGSFFHIAGQTILAEHFAPLQRGTATGFFLAGTVLGPPLGPFVAGIVVTYQSWRVILWLQAGMVGFGLVLSLLFIPRTILDDGLLKQHGWSWKLLKQFNPLPVFRLFTYPNLLFTDLSCGLLAWTQYSLLASPRYILSTSFGLTTPLLSGLFYIAPAGGFLLGTMVGGRLSDHTVAHWIGKRGFRLPQDRLRSGMLSFFFVVPVASLLYGWGLESRAVTDTSAGLALPLIMSFFIAAGLLAAFASLNTYCAEAIPSQRPQVITGKYVVQYLFSALACSTSTPLLKAVGIGAASTIGSILIIIGGILTFFTARKGSHMQAWSQK